MRKHKLQGHLGCLQEKGGKRQKNVGE